MAKLPEVIMWKKHGICILFRYRTDEMYCFANGQNALLEEGQGFPSTLNLTEEQQEIAQELIDCEAEPWIDEHFNEFVPLHELKLDEIMELLLDPTWDGK